MNLVASRTAIIIGAGPAGLTAALELLRRASIKPIVLERSDSMGGLARTVNYKGNRIDIGGHRFFSKSDRVMDWWAEMMPIQSTSGSQRITYQRGTRSIATSVEGPDPERADRVMLLRHRKSRIYFLRQFFDYPLRLSAGTLRKLGLSRTVRIGLSYIRSSIRKIQPEINLEQFFINRFGRELYSVFFKSYTEKVWGVACNQISAEWGAQRIKGVSIKTALIHALRGLTRSSEDIRQKTTETSLIEQFLYPKYGPGQLWETVADEVRTRSGEIYTHLIVDRIVTAGDRIVAVEACDARTGERRTFQGDYFFSTMPVQELVRALDCAVPESVREVSDGLMYRDFITVGLLLKQLRVSDASANGRRLIADNWVYIQEPDVLVGRMQIFNNWSPYMVADKDTVWIGLEYFCYEADELWKKSDAEMIALAAVEMEKIGIISKADVLDGTVIRMPKTYPAYFGAYNRFDVVRQYVDRFENLYLIGRNGMHKYNNQDHSMLTAMIAVDNIIADRRDKSNLWAVNTETEYIESK